MSNQYDYNPDQPANDQVNANSYPQQNQNQNPYQQVPNQHEKQYDDYNDELENQEFMDGIRRGFVRKVYAILTSCLMFTAVMCILPTVNSSVAKFLEDNIWILIVFAILAFIPLYILTCFTNMARRVPTNYILLFSFVFCQSVVVAYACASVDDPKIVMIAALMTMGLTIVLTVFA